MKKFVTILMAFILSIFVLTVEAADKEVNKKLGYFENTRTVLILPGMARGDGDYAAYYMGKEMEKIFRYPYYRTLDASEYKGMTPAELPSILEKSGADIVVLPVVSRWSQWVIYRGFFDDGDRFIETHAVVDLYSMKKGESGPRMERGTYNEVEDEGFVRNSNIMDDISKQILKTFPYKRVPTDISKDLSGDSGSTPVASMNK